MQPLPRVRIVGPLGHVDVHTDTEFRRQVGCTAQRVVGARERGVHAHHATAAGAKEALVLGKAATGALGAVPIGDAVGDVGAHTHRRARVCDDGQAALDRGR